MDYNQTFADSLPDKGGYWEVSGMDEPLRIRQGCVPTKDGTTVRVRIVGDKAFLTLKNRAST